MPTFEPVPLNEAPPVTWSRCDAVPVEVAVPTRRLVLELITTVPIPAVGPILIFVKEPVAPPVPKLIVLIVPTPEAPAWIFVVCETVALPIVSVPVWDALPIASVPEVKALPSVMFVVVLPPRRVAATLPAVMVPPETVRVPEETVRPALKVWSWLNVWDKPRKPLTYQ